MGQKWIICWSHPLWFVGQWVKWDNRCDPDSNGTKISLKGSHIPNFLQPLLRYKLSNF